MTRHDRDIDADIHRLLTIRHNRQTLGYSYYETAHARQPRPKPARKPRPNNFHWHTTDADLLTTTLAYAHAGLDLRGIA